MLPPLQCIIKRAQLSNTNQYLPRAAPDNPDGTSQMDQDGSLRLEGGPVGNPKHAVGK
jgi:hypothetical protein